MRSEQPKNRKRKRPRSEQLKKSKARRAQSEAEAAFKAKEETESKAAAIRKATAERAAAELVAAEDAELLTAKVLAVIQRLAIEGAGSRPRNEQEFLRSESGAEWRFLATERLVDMQWGSSRAEKNELLRQRDEMKNKRMSVRNVRGKGMVKGART